MEDVKNLKTRVLSGLTAVGIAFSGYAAISPVNAFAEGSKYGVTVDEETGIEYNTLRVREGETASTLSSRVVNYFIKNKEVPKADLQMYRDNPNTSCRYWPVVVYLNTKPGCKYHSKEGEEFIFPRTYEELQDLYSYIKKSGWLARYVQNNNIYPKQRVCSVPYGKTKRYVERIYKEKYNDPNYELDDETFDAYIRAHNTRSVKFVYRPDSRLDKDEREILTMYIPLDEELDRLKEEAPKRKVRK